MKKITFLVTIEDVQVITNKEMKIINENLKEKLGKYEQTGIKITAKQNVGSPEFYLYQFGEESLYTLKEIIENESKDDSYMYLIQIDVNQLINSKMQILEIQDMKLFTGNAKDLAIGYNIYKTGYGKEQITENVFDYEYLRNKNKEKNKNEEKNDEKKQEEKENKNLINLNKYKTKPKYGTNHFIFSGVITNIREIKIVAQTKIANHHKIGNIIKCKVPEEIELYSFDANALAINLQKCIDKEVIMYGTIEKIKNKNILNLKEVINFPKLKEIKLSIKKDGIVQEISN